MISSFKRFSWFLTLICHLQSGESEMWSTTSRKVLVVKRFITDLIAEKLIIRIDQHSSQGGTSTSGNVVRRCFIRKSVDNQDFL